MLKLRLLEFLKRSCLIACSTARPDIDVRRTFPNSNQVGVALGDSGH